MKKLAIFLFTAFFCSAGHSQAQVVTKGSHHLFLGYHLFSELQLPYGDSFFGPLTLTYQYAFSKRITAGVQLGYAFGTTDPYTIKAVSGAYEDVKKYFGYTVGLRGDYHYLKSEKLDIYSGLSLGSVIGNYWQVSTPAKHYTIVDFFPGLHALGCRYMLTSQVGVYGELSYTYLGYATIGASACFGRKATKNIKD